MGHDPTRYDPVPQETMADPRLALTLGELISRRWDIRAACVSCGVIVWCDAQAMASALGPDCFIWGRQGRCRVYVGLERCRGRVSFQARPPRAQHWTPLGGDQLARARHLWRVRQVKGPRPPS